MHFSFAASTPLSDDLSSYLDLASQRMGVIGSNVANIDTPGYKTRDMDFVKAFRSASEQHQVSARALVRNVSGLVERPDGNNVSMDRESMAMAEVQLQFRTATALLKREFSRIHQAMEEGK